MRALFKRTMVTIILIAIIVAISGCSLINNLKNESGETKPQTDISQTDEVGAENSIAVGVVELDTYNPLTTKSVTMKNMLGFMFEPLFALDDKLNPVAVLAKSYQTSPDGRSAVINLKENIIWHDGEMFTSDDVIYTMQTIMNNETQYSYLLENVLSVSKNSNLSVNIEFDRSIPNPVALLSFPIIQNKSFTDDFKPTGTGPFYLDYDRLTAFPAYHGGKSQLQSVLIKSVPDNEKFVSMFNASVIDIADSSMINMTEYTPRSNATVNDYVSNEMIFIGFNTNDDVFKYPEARRSVYEVIDRQNIVSHIYFSRAQISHYPINPCSQFYPSSELNPHSDHGAAEKQLKNGGWAQDDRGVYFRSYTMGATYFSVEILVNSEDKERMKIASDLSDSMRELGMKNTIETCSESEFVSRISNGDYDMFVGKTSLLPNNDLTDLVSSDNIFGYSSENTDVLLSQLGTLTLENDKKNVYSQLLENLKEECPIAPVCFLKHSLITSAKLKSGIYPSVSGTVIRTENWSVK